MGTTAPVAAPLAAPSSSAVARDGHEKLAKAMRSSHAPVKSPTVFLPPKLPDAMSSSTER